MFGVKVEKGFGVWLRNFEGVSSNSFCFLLDAVLNDFKVSTNFIEALT